METSSKLKVILPVLKIRSVNATRTKRQMSYCETRTKKLLFSLGITSPTPFQCQIIVIKSFAIDKSRALVREWGLAPRFSFSMNRWAKRDALDDDLVRISRAN